MGEKQSGAHDMPPFPPSIITAFLHNPRAHEERRLTSSRSSRRARARARREILLRERSSGWVSGSTARRADSTTA
jgi:hypothetical protein